MEKRKFNLMLPADLADEVGHQAVRERRRPSHIIADALRDYLARQQSAGPRRPRRATATAGA